MRIFRFSHLSAALLLLLGYVLAPVAASAATANISVVYCADCVPFQFTNAEGEPDGPILDFWKLWSQKTGVSVSYRPARWNDTLSLVKDGKVDAHAGLFFSEQRNAFLDYGPTFTSTDTHVFFHHSITIPETLGELKAFRIAVVKGDLVEDWLKANIGPEAVATFPNYESIIAALNAGDLKVFAADTETGLYHLGRTNLLTQFKLERLKPLYSSDWHVAVGKGNQKVLELIKSGIEKISAEERSLIARTWASGVRTQDPDSIVVSVSSEYPPLSSIGIDGKPQGLLVDLWQEWGKTVGRKIRFKPGLWKDTLEDVRSGQADIHSGLFKSVDREKWLSFSHPIQMIRTGLFAKTDSAEGTSLQDLKGKRLAAVEDTYQSAFIERNHPDIGLHTVKANTDYLVSLMRDEVVAFIEEVPTANALIAKFGLSGAINRRANLFENQVYAGVRKDNPALLALVNTGLERIPRERLREIEKRWISNSEDRFFSGKKGPAQLTATEQAWIAAHPEVTVAATPDWPPFEWKDKETGKHNGISADFIELAAQKVGLKVEPVFGAWSDLIEKLKNKELDVAPGLNRTPERDAFLLFTEPFVEYFSVIFTAEDREDIKTMQDLNGKTIAVEKGYALAEILAKDYPGINLMLVDTTVQALQAVSSTKADAFIGNQLVGTSLIKQYLIPNLKTSGFYNRIPGRFRFGIRDDWPELRSILGKGLAAISEDERSAIFKRHTGLQLEMGKRVKLTDAERDWLSERGPIRLGIDSNWPPFEYVDDNGVYSGLSSAYVGALSDRLDLSMSPALNLSWSEAFQSLKDQTGLVDVLPAVANTPERRKFMNFTKPYLTFPMVIASRKDASYITDLNDLNGKTVGVIRDYYTHEILKTNHPEINLAFTESVASGLEALQQGKTDAFIDNLGVITYEQDRLGLTNVKIAAPTQYSSELSMGVRKDWPELVPILNKALDTIDDKERSVFKNTWLSVQVSFGPDIATLLIWASPFIGSAIAIIVFIVVWNRKLGREIEDRIRTEEELAKSNDKMSLLAQKLSKYLSPQVYETIFSGKQDVTVVTARKKLTVFFSDIKNFTATTEEMEPEDMTYLLNDYLTKMNEIALEHGGTIDKFIGDAIVVFFGDPETKGVKQDALAAVNMAVAMQRRLVDLRAKWADQGYRLPFHIRCGVNTGYCNVGNFGSEQRMDYTIIGGQVNLAARLESICAPDGVTVSYETYSHIRDEFDGEPLEPISVKGIKEPVKPFAIKDIFEDWNEDERYIRRDDIPGLRLWVDMARLNKDQRKASIAQLEEALSTLKAQEGPDA